jgi:chemotaxis protein histidine kinase CheA
MALAEKYVIMFQKECSNLSNIVLNNLHRLKVNPKDSIAIEKMLQAADTMIGDSRFINQKEFEQASMLLVKTFNRVEDVTEKSKEVEFFINIFTKIIKH